MYCVPPRTTSEPNVPPQQNPLFVSFIFPPDVPNFTAPLCAFLFGEVTVTIAVATALLFACDIPVTVTVATMLSPLPSDLVGTPLGATYIPLPEIYPVVWLPPVMPFTCQVTAVVELPFAVAVKACVPNTATEADAG